MIDFILGVISCGLGMVAFYVFLYRPLLREYDDVLSQWKSALDLAERSQRHANQFRLELERLEREDPDTSQTTEPFHH